MLKNQFYFTAGDGETSPMILIEEDPIEKRNNFNKFKS